MEIKQVIPSGCCKGVIRAINMVKETIAKYPDKQIYILGMLVHNKYVVKAFERHNVITLISKEKTKYQLVQELKDGVIIFTAHGIDPKIKQLAIDSGLIVVDATCSDVTKNANLCLEYVKNGYDIIYIGKNNHPESEAVISLSEKIHLVTNKDDISKANLNNQDKILITNQTTMSIYDIQELINFAQSIYPKAILAPEICNATKTRQLALSKLDDVDTLIVVGDPNSNNTTQLANIGAKVVNNVLKIENAEGLLAYDLKDIKKIAITSGASTPRYLTKQVINYLQTNDKKYLEIDLDQILDL